MTISIANANPSAPATATLDFTELAGPRSHGTVIVVPGRGEQPPLYERLGKRLAFDAYRTIVTPAPTDDADATRAEIVAASTGALTPLVLIGSDAGALFLATEIVEGNLPKPDGLVFAGLPTEASSPEFDNWNWERELDARSSCGGYRNQLTAQGSSQSSLRQPVPLDWLTAKPYPQLDVPVLGLHGENDGISPLATVRAIYAQAPDIQLIVIRNGLHDVLNDGTHRIAAATLVLWLESLRAGDSHQPLASPVAAWH